MGLLDLINPEKERAQIGERAPAPQSTNTEVFKAQRKDDLYNYNADGEANRYTEAINRLTEGHFKFNKETEPLEGTRERELRNEIRGLTRNNFSGFQRITKSRELLAEYKALRPDLEIDDIEKLATNIGKEASEASKLAQEGNNTTLGTVAGFAGGFAAAAQDPSEWLAAAIPAGKANSVLRAFAYGAAENAVIEGTKAPIVKELQESIGQKYDAKDAIRQVLTAAAFGGVLSGGGKAVGNIIDSRRVPKLDSDEVRVKGDGVDSLEVESPVVNADSVSVKENGPKLGQQIDEILEKAPDLPEEISDSLLTLKRRVELIEDIPDGVEPRKHLAAVNEIQSALDSGRFPDIERIEALVRKAEAEEGSVKPEITRKPDTVEPTLDDKIHPKYTDEPADNLVQRSEVRAKTIKSKETLSKAREEIENLAETNPNARIKVGDQELSAKEVSELITKNENEIKALDLCEVG